MQRPASQCYQMQPTALCNKGHLPPCCTFYVQNLAASGCHSHIKWQISHVYPHSPNFFLSFIVFILYYSHTSNTQ